jgi:predicted CopG family antitoxin
MTVMRARSKLVYFRVSEEEYAWLHAMCEQTGARSLSDLVRTFLQERRRGQFPGGDGVEELRARIAKLTEMLEKLEERLDGRPMSNARGGV